MLVNRNMYLNQGMTQCPSRSMNSGSCQNVMRSGSQQMRNQGNDTRNCDPCQERTTERNTNLSGRDCSCRERNMERTVNRSDCGCQEQRMPESSCERDWRLDVPNGDRRQLLKYIDEVSFGAYEATLFLDAHPDCTEAMQYFQEHNEKRNFALEKYGKLYGPLTLANVGTDCDMAWKWVNQPWPWEGGNC